MHRSWQDASTCPSTSPAKRGGIGVSKSTAWSWSCGLTVSALLRAIGCTKHRQRLTGASRVPRWLLKVVHARRRVRRAALTKSNADAFGGRDENTCVPTRSTRGGEAKHVSGVPTAAESVLAFILERAGLRSRVQRENPHPLATQSRNLLFNTSSDSVPGGLR